MDSLRPCALDGAGGHSRNGLRRRRDDKKRWRHYGNSAIDDQAASLAKGSVHEHPRGTRSLLEPRGKTEVTGGGLAAIGKVLAGDEEDGEIRRRLRAKEEIRWGKCSSCSGTQDDGDDQERSSLE